jgi:hypothetical protein
MVELANKLEFLIVYSVAQDHLDYRRKYPQRVEA